MDLGIGPEEVRIGVAGTDEITKQIARQPFPAAFGKTPLALRDKHGAARPKAFLMRAEVERPSAIAYIPTALSGRPLFVAVRGHSAAIPSKRAGRRSQSVRPSEHHFDE